MYPNITPIRTQYDIGVPHKITPIHYKTIAIDKRVTPLALSMKVC